MYTLGFRFKPWTSRRRSPTVRRSCPTSRRPPPSRASTSTSATGTRSSPPTGPTPTTGGRCGSSATARRSRSPARSCSRAAGYYNYDEGYSPEFPGADDFHGHDRASAALAGRPRLPGQEDRRDRQWRHRGDFDSRTCQFGCRPRDDAAAVAELHRVAARRRPVRRTDDEKLLPPKLAYVREPVEEHRCCSLRSTGSAGGSPNFMRKQLMTMAERRLPRGLRRRQAFRPELQALGSATVPGAQRGSVPRHPARQADVVTDTIDRFTETGIRLSSR